MLYPDALNFNPRLSRIAQQHKGLARWLPHISRSLCYGGRDPSRPRWLRVYRRPSAYSERVADRPRVPPGAAAAGRGRARGGGAGRAGFRRDRADPDPHQPGRGGRRGRDLDAGVRRTAAGPGPRGVPRSTLEPGAVGRHAADPAAHRLQLPGPADHLGRRRHRRGRRRHPGRAAAPPLHRGVRRPPRPAAETAGLSGPGRLRPTERRRSARAGRTRPRRSARRSSAATRSDAPVGPGR